MIGVDLGSKSLLVFDSAVEAMLLVLVCLVVFPQQDCRVVVQMFHNLENIIYVLRYHYPLSMKIKNCRPIYDKSF